MITLGVTDEEFIVMGSRDELLSRLIEFLSKSKELHNIEELMDEDSFIDTMKDVSFEMTRFFKTVASGSELLYDEDNEKFFLKIRSRDDDELLEVSRDWLEDYEYNIDWDVDSDDYLY